MIAAAFRLSLLLLFFCNALAEIMFITVTFLAIFCWFYFFFIGTHSLATHRSTAPYEVVRNGYGAIDVWELDRLNILKGSFGALAKVREEKEREITTHDTYMKIC